tara:strand:- start:2064 stop:2813 length:750 start_codon:yes stop_codon:yes gene_type:complete
MKKAKKAFVDKSYKLTQDAAPLSFMLPIRHSKRFPLMHFDDSTGVNRELRYSSNQKSCFRDEQDDNVVLTPIIFEDGFLFVPKQEQVLQEFMHYHPLNGKVFVEVDKARDAEDEVSTLMVQADALVEAKSLKLEQLENVCRVLFGSNVSTMSTAELKRDVLVYAKRQPQDFLEVIKDPDLQLLGTIQRLFDDGILQFRKSQKEVWYNTKTNKSKMLNVPFGKDGYDLVAAFFRSDEGIDVLKHLETLID